MKIFSYTLIVALSLAVLGSCTPDNPTINSFDDEWRLLVSGPNGLSTIAMPQGTVANANIWLPPSGEAPYPITSLKEFRDGIYLLRSTPEIIVLSSSTLAVRSTIDLSAYGPATDIAFANATTAYVTLPAVEAVGIVDLTVNQIVTLIQMGSEPAGITSVGNQLCVALPEVDSVVIIDSRTNVVEATLPITTSRPTYVSGDGANDVFCVVSLGAGKVNGDPSPKTTPTLTFIDIPTRVITKSVDLTARASEGAIQIPKGVVVNASEYAFVPVQNALMYASTRSQNKASAAQFENFGMITYDGARAELLCFRPDGKTLQIYNEFAETLKLSVVLPDSVNSVVGIAP